MSTILPFGVVRESLLRDNQRWHLTSWECHIRVDALHLEVPRPRCERGRNEQTQLVRVICQSAPKAAMGLGEGVGIPVKVAI